MHYCENPIALFRVLHDFINGIYRDNRFFIAGLFYAKAWISTECVRAPEENWSMGGGSSVQQQPSSPTAPEDLLSPLGSPTTVLNKRCVLPLHHSLSLGWHRISRSRDPSGLILPEDLLRRLLIRLGPAW